MPTVKEGSRLRIKSHPHLSSVPLQKRQSGLVKLIHLLVDRRVGTSLKNHQLSLLNVLLQRVSKTGGGDHVVSAERDLRWCFDLPQLSLCVVGEHRLGLSHECLERLRRSSPDKIGQGIDVLGPGGVELGGEAPGENPANDHLWNAPQTLCYHLPTLHSSLEKGISFGPCAMQG